jgi:hypothetical protein
VHNAPDVRVEFSDSGVFDGNAGVERLYSASARTRDVSGLFILHMAVNRTSRSPPTDSARRVTAL